MKKLLGKLTGAGTGATSRLPVSAPDDADTAYLTTRLEDHGEDEREPVSWPDRAVAVGAQPFDRARGQALFEQLWAADRHSVSLSPEELARLGDHLAFVSVPAAQDVIRQDERGGYLLVVLEGKLAVERIQPWGGRARLAEAQAGDVLGEMALLDAGGRFSTCATLGPCVLAALEARQLDEMMQSEPRLALALLASLARRLSLRLRQVSARLSALLSGS